MVWLSVLQQNVDILPVHFGRLIAVAEAASHVGNFLIEVGPHLTESKLPVPVLVGVPL